MTIIRMSVRRTVFGGPITSWTACSSGLARGGDGDEDIMAGDFTAEAIGTAGTGVADTTAVADTMAGDLVVADFMVVADLEIGPEEGSVAE
jgi:hypothetical protein